MIRNTNAFQLGSTFRLLKRSVDHHDLTGSVIEQYGSLLHKIGRGFGFSENESREIIEHVCLHEKRNNEEQKHGYTLKILLSKIMVHRCIFKISGVIFSQGSGVLDSSIQHSKHHYHREAFQMPLSFRAVYILFHYIGFSETEIAEILNINPFEVRVRLGKALRFIKGR